MKSLFTNNVGVVLIALVFVSMFSLNVWPNSTTLSGGFDLRFGLEAVREVKMVTGLSGMFVNLRKVFSDEEGDRFIFVGQIDVEEEIARTHLYQLYGQYKGALGKWNIRAGRYLVPFGLNAYYDTERLLLPAHEAEALGIKLDDGVELLGRIDWFDYAVSVSRALTNQATPIVRVGLEGDDIRIGLSYMYGRLPSFGDEESVVVGETLPGAVIIGKHRVAIDYEHILGPLTLRVESIAGFDEDRLIYGGYAEAGFAFSPELELSANGAYLRSELTGTRWRVGGCVSFRFLPGVFGRIAYIHRDDFGKTSDTFFTQFYAEFSQALGE